MAFVGMDSFRHYQHPNAGPRRDGHPTASSLRVPVASGESNKPTLLESSKKLNGTPQDFGLIEIVDKTGSTTKEPLNATNEPASDLDCTEADASDTSNGLNSTRGYGHSGIEEDSDFLPVGQLLLGAGKAQERQRTGSSDGHVTGGSEGNFEHLAEGNRNSIARPRSSHGEIEEQSVAVGDGLAVDRNTHDAQRGTGGSIGVYTSDDSTADRGDKGRKARPDKSIVPYYTDSDDSDAYYNLRNEPPPQFKYPSILGPEDGNNRASSTRNKPGSPGNPIMVEDKDTDSSGDGTSEEQVGTHISLRTSPTSVGGSEARYLNLHEKSGHDTPNTSPLHRNTLSSTPGKQTYRSTGGDREGLIPNPSTGRDKKNPWNGQEAGADNEEEGYNGDSDKTTPSLGSIKKRYPSAAKGPSISNHRVKRRRCLSPKPDKAVGSQGTIFAVPEQDLDTHPDGTSPESMGVQPKFHNTTMPRGPATGTAIGPAIEPAQGGGDAQQEWEIIRIVGKRTTRSGKKYRVRWADTWLSKRELRNARKLLQEFEAKRPARHGRERRRPA